jgi:uncharacterized membrane protein
MFLELPTWLVNVLFPLNRWLHLVAMTMLVGGVLFFEFVVPLATADLKEEQQLAVFGRARWVFRKIVWLSLVALILTGAISMWRMWWIYQSDAKLAGGFWLGSMPWAVGHIILGVIAFAMVLRVTSTRRLHGNPVGWLQAALVVMLICIFLVCVARQVRMRLFELREMHNLPHDVRGGEVN